MPRILLAGLFGLALLLAGCGAESQHSHDQGDPGDTAVGHIHGVGIDPADDTLYVATHLGLFHVSASGESERVADRWQDTMAFTIAGPGQFLASGHPDLEEDLPAQLGLIESTDAGKTWQALALQGEADFHILEQAGDTLYAYDAASGRLLATQNNRSFDEVAQLPLLSLTTEAKASDRLLGTTGEGALISIDPDAGTVTDLGGPTLTYLDTTPTGDIAGLDPTGTIQISTDSGKTWTSRGNIGGQPTALTITENGWYAATAEHVYRSADEGTSWTRVF